MHWLYAPFYRLILALTLFIFHFISSVYKIYSRYKHQWDVKCSKHLIILKKYELSCSSSLVSLEVFSPAQILLIVQTTAIRHSFFFLPFSLFSSPWNSKNFFSQFLLFFSVFLSTLSCFLFKSPFLSFLFSYYSILSTSSLCSITI